MSINRNAQILYLQSECLLKYSQRKNKSLKESSLIFQKYHIFEYISDCYDYLHLWGIAYLVNDIIQRIEKGVDFAAGYEG